jgi:alpha/beta superfamily hydrolase
MSTHGTSAIPGPEGKLEAIYRFGSKEADRAAVVCHPHPLHGGTMHNKVVYRAAKAFEGLGWSVLRFNFRGVGASQGSFADGPGEADDVAAALDWLAERNPGMALVVAGFSFGCAIGLPVGAVDDRVSYLVGIGTPTDRFRFELLADVLKPKLFVHGANDEHGPLPELEAGLARVAKPWELVVVEGADHFFEGRLPELQRAIVDYFAMA